MPPRTRKRKGHRAGKKMRERRQKAQLYKQLNEMWDGALWLCGDYVPVQESSSQMELPQATTTTEETTSDTTEEPKMVLQNADIHTVLEMVITAPENKQSDLIKAADILLHHAERATTMDLGPILGSKLYNVGEYALAAQVFLCVDQRNDAIDALIGIDDWPLARSIIREFDPNLEPYVYEIYHQAFSTSKHEFMAAKNKTLDNLIKQGDWDEIYEITRNNPEIVQEQLNKRVADLIKSRNYIPALLLSKKFGTHMYACNWKLFVKLAMGIFNSTEVFTNYKHLHILRAMLLQLYNSVSSAQKKGVLKRFLEAAHFASVKLVCEDIPKLNNIRMNCAVSLLRYTDFVLADRAYYEAGLAVRSGGSANLNEAFVLLNHFLNLEEWIENRSKRIVDVMDISCTDFPRRVPMNDFLGVERGKREEVRNWIRGVSIVEKVTRSLPIDDRGVYVGSLSCPTSPTKVQACALTGYPARDSVIKFNGGNQVVDRADWTEFLNFANRAPEDSNITSTLDFILEWFGDISSSTL